ncbi:hypothetical protein F5B21DRAFT_440697 [Xylaria acuta]|nr:hypothetical protein F5B21DRAFT_440697 [Xylaria acuta]
MRVCKSQEKKTTFPNPSVPSLSRLRSVRQDQSFPQFVLSLVLLLLLGSRSFLGRDLFAAIILVLLLALALWGTSSTAACWSCNGGAGAGAGARRGRSSSGKGRSSSSSSTRSDSAGGNLKGLRIKLHEILLGILRPTLAVELL